RERPRVARTEECLKRTASGLLELGATHYRVPQPMPGFEERERSVRALLRVAKSHVNLGHQMTQRLFLEQWLHSVRLRTDAVHESDLRPVLQRVDVVPNVRKRGREEHGSRTLDGEEKLLVVQGNGSLWIGGRAIQESVIQGRHGVVDSS